MKRMVVGFSRPIKWKPYAKAIMAIDGTDYDHLYIRFNTDRMSLIYQASGNRTNFMGMIYFLKNNIAVEEYEIIVTDKMYDDMVLLMMDREGIPYAIKQVIGKGIAAIWNKIFKKKIRNPFKGNDKQSDCIEEGAIILGLDPEANIELDMNTVTPKPVRDYIAKNRAFRRIK